MEAVCVRSICHDFRSSDLNGGLIQRALKKMRFNHKERKSVTKVVKGDRKRAGGGVPRRGGKTPRGFFTAGHLHPSQMHLPSSRLLLKTQNNNLPHLCLRKGKSLVLTRSSRAYVTTSTYRDQLRVVRMTNEPNIRSNC